MPVGLRKGGRRITTPRAGAVCGKSVLGAGAGAFMRLRWPARGPVIADAHSLLRVLSVQSERLSFGPIGGFVSNLSDLTSLKPRRNHARSEVRLKDLVKIRGMSECLGKGVSGTVWKVRDRSVDETLALKEMAMDTADEGKCQVPSRRRPAALAPHPR